VRGLVLAVDGHERALAYVCFPAMLSSQASQYIGTMDAISVRPLTAAGCAVLAAASHARTPEFLATAQKRICCHAICDLGNHQRRSCRRFQQGFNVSVQLCVEETSHRPIGKASPRQWRLQHDAYLRVAFVDADAIEQPSHCILATFENLHEASSCE